MHTSQFLQMGRSIEAYMPMTGTYNVLELGSRNPKAEHRTHRSQMAGRTVSYIGIDLLPGYNVDRVMEKPYSFPVRSRTVDILISGAVFEHVPFLWATMLEIGRVLRPGGYAFVVAPSRGHVHNVYDCWRIYPDGFRALAAWAGLELRDVFTDFPPNLPGRHHHDYAAINTKMSYWGDSVAVFQKPKTGYPEIKLGLLRQVVQRWANATPDLEGVPRPPVDPLRRRLLGR